MSGHGAESPGWGHGVPGGNTDPSSEIHALASSRTVPVYLLFLIMLGSGIVTLVVLWVCIPYVYYRRRVQRARTDVERVEWESRHGPSGSLTDVMTVPDRAMKCEYDAVELTYVVMAGEPGPTFLAHPSSPSEHPPSPSPSAPTTTALDDGAYPAEKSSALQS